jgi:hypothetical protein
MLLVLADAQHGRIVSALSSSVMPALAVFPTLHEYGSHGARLLEGCSALQIIVAVRHLHRCQDTALPRLQSASFGACAHAS